MPKDSNSKGFDTGDADSEGDDRDESSRETRLRLIVDFWSAISISGETGATDRATLEGIEREVAEVFYRDRPDVDQAESLTAMAFHLISGNI
jgi:hypothetical protein